MALPSFVEDITAATSGAIITSIIFLAEKQKLIETTLDDLSNLNQVPEEMFRKWQDASLLNRSALHFFKSFLLGMCHGDREIMEEMINRGVPSQGVPSQDDRTDEEEEGEEDDFDESSDGMMSNYTGYRGAYY